MKSTLTFLTIVTLISSCSSNYEDKTGIEVHPLHNNNDSITLSELYGSGEVKKYETLKVGRNYSPSDKPYTYTISKDSSAKKQSQNIKISKEEALEFGYGALAFSFEASSEYTVHYFTTDGALVKLQLIKKNELISEISFTTKQFDQEYGLKDYKQHLEEFSRDESTSNIKATLIEKEYFGKNSLNTLMEFNNSEISSLAMMIPSLEKDIYLMCVLSKKNINIDKPFNQLEDNIFKTLTINSVPLNEITSAYK